MQYLQKTSQSKGHLVNQRQKFIDDSILNESNHLDSESFQENLKTLINCKAELTLSTKESCNSNSFTLSNNKFNFFTNEILEWETLDNALPPEVYNFLSILKCQCYAGTITYTDEQIELLINQSQIYVKNLLEFLNQILDKGWILKTIRILNGSTINFYALAVKNLTFENLFWIIKSLKKDLITPTERLVQSRIKECYGFKYKRNEWDLIINQIKSEKQIIQFRSSQGKLFVLPMIQVILIKDPFIQEETQGIYIKHQNWKAEDEFQEALYQEQEWNIFIEYLQSIIDNQNDQNHKFFKDGGYGCAQFIKHFGPKNLRKLSLGRLTIYMQMAINKNYIRNTKKVLVQNNREKSEYATDSSQDQEENIKMKIEELKEQLIQLLLENQDGVSFTQIPKLLKKRVNFKINLFELGFPNLRNFIESNQDMISIEKNSKNNVIAKLDQIKYWNKYQNKIGGDLSNQAISSNILELLKNILSKHQYGISINQLYYDLSQLLGEWFNFRKFQCLSFFQFLQNYAENILIIVCQKGNQYLIYEKDLRFMPSPTSNQDNNDQQSDHNFSEEYQSNLGLSLQQTSFSNSWLEKAGDSQLKFQSLQLIEDSHQEIKENLKFIDEILGLQIFQLQGYELKQNDTYSIQDWSDKSMNYFEMLSSINYGHSEKPAYFDLTKELQNSLSQKQQIQKQFIQLNESKKK
ncbi:unnamed protein product [Paramecium octaurelia]|uniref:HTH OST-type domain-containing protein n=1 Tax=Paramecium octaurelia TaxID=43137 RepID=A0A8S1RYF3_PAROT|nr:unnamed protein product [Paramecium octaurelia]